MARVCMGPGWVLRTAVLFVDKNLSSVNNRFDGSYRWKLFI